MEESKLKEARIKRISDYRDRLIKEATANQDEVSEKDNHSITTLVDRFHKQQDLMNAAKWCHEMLLTIQPPPVIEQPNATAKLMNFRGN